MQPRQILHCDCNCFYASVEAQEHPEYRGKRLGTASYSLQAILPRKWVSKQGWLYGRRSSDAEI